MVVTQNIQRLKHLLDLFQMSAGDLLEILNSGRKRMISEADLFSEEIELSLIKKIDKVFDRGIYYYFDPSPPVKTKESSIFFRKDSFNSDLEIGDKVVVNKFESKKFYISAISKMSGISFDRSLPKYTTEDDPREAGMEVRKIVNPRFSKNEKKYLTNLINAISNHQVFVFEHIDRKKTFPMTTNGFFMKPNIIVIKRGKYYKREIFTLGHELGHYLLDEEEIEEVNEGLASGNNDSVIERWCDSFSFHFLLGELIDDYYNINSAKNGIEETDRLVNSLSSRTQLSTLAIYTNLALQGQITWSQYKRKKALIMGAVRASEESRQLERDRSKELGINQSFFSPQRPIKSQLFIETIQAAYYEGVLSESQVCKELGIKGTELHKYIG